MQTKVKLLPRSNQKLRTKLCALRGKGSVCGSLLLTSKKTNGNDQHSVQHENSVIWASVQLFRDLPRSRSTDLSPHLCSNCESQENDSVGVETILLSLTVPLFAPILGVRSFPDTSCSGNTITAGSSASGQRFDARVAIIRLLHLYGHNIPGLGNFRLWHPSKTRATHRGHSHRGLSVLLGTLNILSTSDFSCLYTSTMPR